MVGRPPPAPPVACSAAAPILLLPLPCLQEPYFSSKQQKSKAAGSSELVQLKKAAASMSRDFQAGRLHPRRWRFLCPGCALPQRLVNPTDRHQHIPAASLCRERTV